MASNDWLDRDLDRCVKALEKSEPETIARIRTFATGATRDQDTNKLDYEGFLCPLVIKRYAEYMHANRKQSDGNLRASDNWQKGIPLDQYAKSGWRHFMEWWWGHRAGSVTDDCLCALMFNVMGYLHEKLATRERAAMGKQAHPMEFASRS